LQSVARKGCYPSSVEQARCMVIPQSSWCSGLLPAVRRGRVCFASQMEPPSARTWCPVGLRTVCCARARRRREKQSMHAAHPRSLPARARKPIYQFGIGPLLAEIESPRCGVFDLPRGRNTGLTRKTMRKRGRRLNGRFCLLI
jgi:hypothetical protein